MNKLIRYQQLLQLISALFKEVIRQPAVIFWGVVFPILMALGLGIAFTQKGDIVHNVALIETQGDFSTNPKGGSRIDAFLTEYTAPSNPVGSESARFKMTIEDDRLGNTTFVFLKTSWKQAMVLLKRGNLSIVLDEYQNRIRYHFDPMNPDAQLTYLKLSKIIGRGEIRVVDQTESIAPLSVRGTRYIDFLIPGLIAMGIMMSCMWGMSYGMIEKRSRKLLRRMVATPMQKSHFLMALMIVRIAMNFIESVLLFIFAYLVFDITIQGSIPALVLFFIAGNIAFGGIAIFVSSRTANTEIGNGLINVVVMPMMVLSGIFFSYHHFPDWSIFIIQKLPLTLLADGIRSIFIEGAGFSETALPTLILLTIGVVFFTTGLRIFKWH